MNSHRNFVRYIPEALAVAAGVLTVVAVLAPSQSVRTALFAGALALAIMGWLWTMREQRHLKDVEMTRADKLSGEKAELERLLDGAINSQLGQGGPVDINGTLTDLAATLDAHIAACFLLETGIGMLRPQPGAFGVGPGQLQDFMLGSTPADLVNQVLGTGTSRVKSRGEDLPRILPKGWANGAVLLAPMTMDGDIVGILVVGAPGRETFTRKDAEVATATAAGLGAALINERLMANSRQQLRHSTVIKEVALAVNSTLDLGDVLHLFLGKARGIVDYDRASVVLFQADQYHVAALVDADGGLRRRPH